MELSSLNEVFQGKLFRIPDYQRGYSWQKQQLIEFWDDIERLQDGKIHYMGVLSLETIAGDKLTGWDKDKWLIQNKDYKPFFVVDGQQRLTTCIILIQAIIEAAKTLPQNTEDEKNKDDFELCDTKLSDFRERFICLKRKIPAATSFVFGYQRDNPSDECLKNKIFGEPVTEHHHIETVYTHNLENAKTLFHDNVTELTQASLETILKKVTRQLKFNEYVMHDDIDPFVAFESMNNRGKQLSNLEKLKNRLMYLSTLCPGADTGNCAQLRERISGAWKEIYYQLGRNKASLLDDDDFLKAHWAIDFKYTRNKGDDYIRDLLNNRFSPKRIAEVRPAKAAIEDSQEIRDVNIEDEDIPDQVIENEGKKEERTKLEQSEIRVDIENYAESIKKSVRHWYFSFNPANPLDNRGIPMIPDNPLTEEEQLWVERLNRIGMGYFRPLVVGSLMREEIPSPERVKLFSAIEQYIFVGFRLSQLRADNGRSEFTNLARDLYKKDKEVSDGLTMIDRRLKQVFTEDGNYKSSRFMEFITSKYVLDAKDGFYGWGGLKYFLYEYEDHLRHAIADKRQKIAWQMFRNSKDKVSIEHILPQTPDEPEWRERFSMYNEAQLNALTHSLGNLLALSLQKNIGLQNKCYSWKRCHQREDGQLAGYFNGSYSENEVAEKYKTEWTAMAIRQRGLRLLEFMEKRWEITIGGESTKLKLLNVEFVES